MVKNDDMMQRICTNMETLEFVHAWQLFLLLEDGILLSVGEAPKSLTRDDVSSENRCGEICIYYDIL
jgi:hypothetical protein